jgi:hypothetical protein
MLRVTETEVHPEYSMPPTVSFSLLGIGALLALLEPSGPAGSYESGGVGARLPEYSFEVGPVDRPGCVRWNIQFHGCTSF